MTLDPGKMCFGLSDDLDRESFLTFLQLCGRKEFAELLATRVTREEITGFVDMVFLLLRKHFNENEYHRYFLLDPHHHDKE